MKSTSSLLVVLSILLGFDTNAALAADAQKKPAAEAKKETARTEKVDLNNASLNELKAIGGIGDAQAKKIVDGRPYTRRRDLLSKKIIDEQTYDKIKDKVYTKR